MTKSKSGARARASAGDFPIDQLTSHSPEKNENETNNEKLTPLRRGKKPQINSNSQTRISGETASRRITETLGSCVGNSLSPALPIPKNTHPPEVFSAIPDSNASVRGSSIHTTPPCPTQGSECSTEDSRCAVVSALPQPVSTPPCAAKIMQITMSSFLNNFNATSMHPNTLKNQFAETMRSLFSEDSVKTFTEDERLLSEITAVQERFINLTVRLQLMIAEAQHSVHENEKKSTTKRAYSPQFIPEEHESPENKVDVQASTNDSIQTDSEPLEITDNDAMVVATKLRDELRPAGLAEIIKGKYRPVLEILNLQSPGAMPAPNVCRKRSRSSDEKQQAHETAALPANPKTTPNENQILDELGAALDVARKLEAVTASTRQGTRDRYSPQEDIMIVKGVKRFGENGRWAEIYQAYQAEWAPGRTPIKLYDHWRQCLKRRFLSKLL